MKRSRIRRLYDLPLIPAPRNETASAAGRYYPEVRVIWGGHTLVDVWEVKKSCTIGWGDSADVLLTEDLFPEKLHNLISCDKAGAHISLLPEMNGRIIMPDGTKALDSDSAVLTPAGVYVLEFGAVTIAVSLRKRETLLKRSLFSDLNPTAAFFIAFVCVAGIAFISAISELPPIEVEALELNSSDRWTKMLTTPKVEEPKTDTVKPEVKIKIKTQIDGSQNFGSIKKSIGDEGRIGKKTSTVMNTQGTGRAALDNKVAISSGMMGVLSSGAAAFDRVFGGGGLGAGLDKVLGSVTGITGVDQWGSGGLGVKNFGTGGGGTTLGIGSLNTRGRKGGGGLGSAMAYGMDQGKVNAKGLSAISAGGGTAVIMGSIDKAMVDSYIKRNIMRIKACYERELQKNDQISGKVSLFFIINGEGGVTTSNVKTTTMGNAGVEECVARTVKTIRFPKPKGGGVVAVTYPFIFKNAIQ